MDHCQGRCQVRSSQHASQSVRAKHGIKCEPISASQSVRASQCEPSSAAFLASKSYQKRYISRSGNSESALSLLIDRGERRERRDVEDKRFGGEEIEGKVKGKMRRGEERTREGERRVGGTRRVIEEERGEEKGGREKR